MPFASTAQQRWAFGTGQPFAKRWAAETDFAKLPRRVKRIRSRMGLKGCTCKAATEGSTVGHAAPTASAPGPAGAKPSAGGGGSLGPGITRIRGNLCNVHGRYGPCDKALSKKPKGGKGRAAKPKKTPEQRAAERQQQQQANVDKTLTAVNMSDEAASTLLSLASGEGGGGDDFGLIKQGLVERDTDGNLRLSGSGRTFYNAAKRGDLGAARDAMSRGRDQVARSGERTTARQQRQQAASQRRQQAEQRRQQAEQKRQQRAAAMAKRDQERAVRQAAREARRRAAQGKRSKAMDTTKATWDTAWINNLPDSSFLFVESGGKKDADGKTVPRSLRHFPYKDSTGKIDLPHLRNAIARIPQSNAPGLNKDATQKRAQAMLQKANASTKDTTIQVFKDASGADRWLLVSSTAYRDRDQEIVSTKALEGAVALADASGVRGPLRFWHVPGIELGDCDFQGTAQGGRFLIESGTFRSPALAAAVKAAADRLAVSIGFTHPTHEPDANGVFDHIAIFERSLVPKGRAANPFTQVAIKETRMLTAEKETELKQLLGGDTALIEGLLGQVVQTDKTAQENGVAFKETDLRVIIRAELAALLGQTAEKATDAPSAPEGSPEEEATESPEEAAAEGDTEDTGDENMLTDAEIAAIAQATAAAVLDQLMPHLGIGQKMDELKTMMGGLSGGYAKKDAELAEVKTDLAAVKAQLADLAGDTPRILVGGYRASASKGTITTDETKLKEAQPNADPVAAAFGDFMSDLGFAPKQPSA